MLWGNECPQIHCRIIETNYGVETSYNSSIWDPKDNFHMELTLNSALKSEA